VPLPALGDEVLIEQMCNESTDALGTLFHRYYRLVFNVAKNILRDRSEAEDVMQEVFLEIYRRAELYDPTKGSVKTWILQYAYHRSFNRRKYLALRGFYDAMPALALSQLELTGKGGWREAMSSGEWREVLQGGMRELNEKERGIIQLVALEGFTLREASAKIGESYVNSRNHYYRALKKLKEIMRAQMPALRREVNNVRS
jgi:RNA polymerase sigma-70 factor, ECF subfamily